MSESWIKSEYIKILTSGGSYLGAGTGFMGLSALIKGSIYVNDGEEVCPWSPKIPIFLLTHGVVTFSWPVCILAVAIFAYITKLRSDLLWSCISYLYLSTPVINIGLLIWGFVLLYSNPNSVSFEEYDHNTWILDRDYCDYSLYVVSMVVLWGFVALLIVAIVYCIWRYVKLRKTPSDLLK